MPLRPRSDSNVSASTGRPSPLLLPEPSIASGRRASLWARTASTISLTASGWILCTKSEPRQVRERQASAADMHRAQLRAAMQGREYLAGIEQLMLVERAFEAHLLGEVDLVEHRRHQVALFDPDAVLAGQHAADLDAQFQDLGAESLGGLELARLVGIVEDERLQVPVAGVEHVCDPEPE